MRASYTSLADSPKHRFRMAISLTRMGEDGSDRLMALCMVIFHEIDYLKNKIKLSIRRSIS